MFNLNKLTVPYIEKLAKEFNITFKSSDKKPDKIRKIKNAGIPEDRLEKQFKKYLARYEESKKKSTPGKVKSSQQSSYLVKRIDLLENQIKYIMSKIGSIEIILAKDNTDELVGGGFKIAEIQNIIKSKILPRDSISIDELISLHELDKYPKNLIEKAIINLIDDEIFDVSEGRSIQKILGNIGRLIRR